MASLNPFAPIHRRMAGSAAGWTSYDSGAVSVLLIGIAFLALAFGLGFVDLIPSWGGYVLMAPYTLLAIAVLVGWSDDRRSRRLGYMGF